MEENDKVLKQKGKKFNFLLDTSSILYFEKLHKHCGASIFEGLKECSDCNFFVLSDVLSELLQGRAALNPHNLGMFFDHILSPESAMDKDRKENRFLINTNGKLTYIVLNNVSATDYAQILICQNHSELTLVANDRKMIKSASQVIPNRRTLGLGSFVDRLVKICPTNKRFEILKKTADEIFDKKPAFVQK